MDLGSPAAALLDTHAYLEVTKGQTLDATRVCRGLGCPARGCEGDEVAARTPHMEVCKEGADAQTRNVERRVIFAHLIRKLPGCEKAERKGEVTAWHRAVCAFDAYI